jgi:hypothetical protein
MAAMIDIKALPLAPSAGKTPDKKIPALLSARGIKDIASVFAKIGDTEANVNKHAIS